MDSKQPSGVILLSPPRLHSHSVPLFLCLPPPKYRAKPNISGIGRGWTWMESWGRTSIRSHERLHHYPAPHILNPRPIPICACLLILHRPNGALFHRRPIGHGYRLPQDLASDGGSRPTRLSVYSVCFLVRHDPTSQRPSMRTETWNHSMTTERQRDCGADATHVMRETVSLSLRLRARTVR